MLKPYQTIMVILGSCSLLISLLAFVVQLIKLSSN
ncbi:putative holin-like toxin [Desulfitobacterium sp.]